MENIIKTTIETITPEIASHYIAMSGGNRPISKDTVAMYVARMKGGEWKLNGDAIKFDSNGKLLDGHHRLHACIKSNTVFQSIVVRGVEPSCFTTYDIGRHRNLGQMLAINGVKKNYNLIAGGITFYFRILKDNEYVATSNISIRSINKPYMDLVKFYDDNCTLISSLASFYNVSRSRVRLLQGSWVIGIMIYLIKDLGYDYDFTKSFFSQLHSFDTSEISSINLLRKRLIQESLKKTRIVSDQIVYALIIKSWNAYVKKKEIKTLNFNPAKDKFPTFIKKDNKLL